MSSSEETADVSSMHKIGVLVSSVCVDIVSSPINAGLLVLCGILLYKIIKVRLREEPPPVVEDRLPMLKKQDMTLGELRKYDGTGEDGRVLVAVCGKVYDVTYRGKQFYGPGSPYELFAGRDASRALATFSLDSSSMRDEYDDLSDLRSDQMTGLKEWELQFSEKYVLVGKLLKPGEAPTVYDDEEDEDEEGTESAAKRRSKKE